MKILHLHENYKPIGGSEIYIRDLIQELKKKNIACDWYVIRKENMKYKIHFNTTEQSDIPIEILSQQLDNYFLNKTYDLVHMHGISDIEVIKYFLDRYPVVRSMHEPRLICPGYGKFLTVSLEPCTLKFGLHCLYKAYTEKCQLSRKPKNIWSSYKRVVFEVNEASFKYKKIITMSNYVKNEAIKAGIEKNIISLIPYFTKFNLSYNYFGGVKKRILFVGRLSITKGIIFLLKAMAPLLKNSHDVYLDIVGNGDQKTKILTLIDSEGIKDKVYIHGWKSSEEISHMMKNAYCIAFPSIYPEAFGIVGIEAFAHSKPVIGFDVGGVSTWLKDGYNGYLVENKNINKLRDCINNLLNNKELYKRFTYNAYQTYLDDFIAEKHLNKLIEIYKISIDEKNK